MAAHRSSSSQRHRHRHVPRHRRAETGVVARAAMVGTASAVAVGAAFGLGHLPAQLDDPEPVGGAAADAILHERADRPSRGGLGRAPLLGAGIQTRAQAAQASPAPSAPQPVPAPAVEIPDGCDDYSGNRAIGCALLAEFGFGLDQMPALDQLWTRESGWNHLARNPSSGAYGIPQALPGSKMATAGDDWQTNPATQIRWGLGYISDRYGNPDAAWAFFQANGWY